jgi:8-oxo-dGTP pyrophosphatase MutT (NUDIX family)
VSPIRRTAARVVVVDDSGAVLLFRVVDPVTGWAFWETPGGGAEWGEELATTAARELWEETGQSVRPEELGGVVAVERGDWEFWGSSLTTENWYFVVRTAPFEVSTAGWDAAEHLLHHSWRWWKADELATAEERVFPSGLGDLLAAFEAGELGDGPRELPWGRARRPR